MSSRIYILFERLKRWKNSDDFLPKVDFTHLKSLWKPWRVEGLSPFCQLPRWEAQASGLEKLAKMLHCDPLICFRSLLSAHMANLICFKPSLALVSPFPLLNSPSLSRPYPEISVSVCFLIGFISQILEKKSLSNLTKIQGDHLVSGGADYLRLEFFIDFSHFSDL